MYQFISSSKKGRNCFDRHLTMEETGPERLRSFLKVTLGTAAGIFSFLLPIMEQLGNYLQKGVTERIKWAAPTFTTGRHLFASEANSGEGPAGRCSLLYRVLTGIFLSKPRQGGACPQLFTVIGTYLQCGPLPLS